MKNILLITDGKAGHESVSRGTLENLNEFIDINVITIHVKMRSNLFKPILKLLSNNENFHKFFSLNLINFFYSFDHKKINFNNIDLIISTGGKTSFINLLLSKLHNIPNIYCSSLRGLKPELFSYIETINYNDTYANALHFDIAPLKIKCNKEKATSFLNNLELDNNQKIWTILLGGPTKQYMFKENEFIDMIDKIIKKAKKENAKVLLTTSRRTPKNIETYIEKTHKNYDNLVYFVLYNKKPEKTMGLFLQVSHIIFSTEDSTSMITEAIYSKKPTITIKSKNNNPKNSLKALIERNTKNGFIYSCYIDEIDSLNINSIKFNTYDDKKNIENFMKIKNLL